MTTYTLFNRDECYTVDRVRRMGRDANIRSTNWRRIGAAFATMLGRFQVWRCDDTIVVFTVLDGKVRQKSHRPNTWRYR